MLKRILILCFIPGLLLAQVQPYTNMPVGGIDVVIHKVENSDGAAIRSTLKTKVGENFSQLDFDEDLKHLSEEYDRVEPTLTQRGDRIFITLNLWPRPLIRSILFEGNKGVKSGKLRKELDVQTDTLLNRNELAAKFNNLREYYVKKGHFEAQLSYDIVPDPNKNAVDIIVCVDEGRSGRVKKISFEGFSRAEERALLEMIYTKKHFFLTSWITKAGTYHEEAVEQDRYTVLNYLHNQGYADADVQMNVVDLSGKGLELKIVAERGRLYDFGTITFSGNTLFTDEEIESILGLKAGEPYSPEALRNTAKRIQDLYGSKGYIEAVADYEPQLKATAYTYDVHFDIYEGEQYRVGLVRVFGNRCTQDRVILHESTVTPGEVYDVRRIQQTEAILRNVGYFENVNVYAVRPPAEEEIGPYYRDIYIEVEEAGTGSVGLFGGASTLDSIFGGIELIEKNFNIAGLPHIFRCGPRALRGGGEYLQFKVNFGKKQRSYTASWTKPFFMDSCWVVGVDLNRTLSNLRSDDYTIKNWSINTRANYPVARCVNFGFHGRIRYNNTSLSEQFRDQLEKSRDRQRIYHGETIHVQREGRFTEEEARADRDGRTDEKWKDEFRFIPGAEKLLKEADSSGPVVAWGASIVYDSVDWCHSRGLRCVLDGEIAAWPGDFQFLSIAYLNTYYHPLGRLGVLKLRSDNRFIMPIWGQDLQDIPLGERIFLGGETTIRGFHPFSLGPQFGTDEPRGGFSSMLVSAEINKCMFPRVEGFVFLDGGYLSGKAWEVDDFIWSAGFGFRLDIMNGMPLMLGWGYPFNVPEDKKNEIEHFFFSFGGRF